MPHVTTPHFAVPFSLAGPHTSALVVEQDTAEDIAGCVEAVLRYTVGERLALPEFGITDPTFLREPDLDEIGAALEEFEPRAQAAIRDVTDELLAAQTIDEATRVIRVALEG